MVNGGIAWSPCQGLLLRAEAGVYPCTELEVVDTHGDVVRRLRSDLVGFVGLGLTLTWSLLEALALTLNDGEMHRPPTILA